MISDTSQSGSLGLSGLFLPQDLGVNTVWDAANPAGNLIIPADGTALSSISDLGLNGNTVVQATGTNQPIFKKNIVNGQNVFRFSGNQYASIAGGSGNNYNGPLSVFAIGMTTAATTLQHFLSKTPNPSTGGYGIGCNASSQADMTVWLVQDIVGSSTLWVNNTFQVLGVVYKSDNSVDFYKNRSFIQNVAGVATTASTAPFVFGAKTSSGVDQWSGDFSAVFIAFRQFATWEINAMLNYCCCRIGI